MRASNRNQCGDGWSRLVGLQAGRLSGCSWHRLNGYLTEWVSSPPGEHTFQNCTQVKRFSKLLARERLGARWAKYPFSRCRCRWGCLAPRARLMGREPRRPPFGLPPAPLSRSPPASPGGRCARSGGSGAMCCSGWRHPEPRVISLSLSLSIYIYICIYVGVGEPRPARSARPAPRPWSAASALGYMRDER